MNRAVIWSADGTVNVVETTKTLGVTILHKGKEYHLFEFHPPLDTAPRRNMCVYVEVPEDKKRAQVKIAVNLDRPSSEGEK